MNNSEKVHEKTKAKLSDNKKKIIKNSKRFTAHYSDKHFTTLLHYAKRSF